MSLYQVHVQRITVSQVTNHRSEVRSHRSQTKIASHNSWPSHKLQVISHKSLGASEQWVISHQWQVMSHKSWSSHKSYLVTSHQGQVMSHRVASHKLLAPGHESPVTSCWSQFTNRSCILSQVISHRSLRQYVQVLTTSDSPKSIKLKQEINPHTFGSSPKISFTTDILRSDAARTSCSCKAIYWRIIMKEIINSLLNFQVGWC